MSKINFSRKQQAPTVPWRHWRHGYFWVATSGGMGLTPLRGPGGALVALPIAYFTHLYGGMLGVLVLAAALFAFGLGAATWWEKVTGTHDNSPIVIDETVGLLMPLALLSPHLMYNGYILLAVWGSAWLVFVLVDWLKPYPLRRLEKLPAGWGVMVDDVGAGVYTTLLLGAGCAAWMLFAQ